MMQMCKDYNKTHKFKKQQPTVEQQVKDTVPILILKPNVEAVQDDLIYYNVKYPDVVLQQAIWETGWFKSNVCKEYNNLFGFKTDKGYLKFDTWEESIKYYKNWQNRKYKGGDYYHFLDTLPYSGDSLYKDHLKSIHVNKRELQGISSDTLQSTQ